MIAVRDVDSTGEALALMETLGLAASGVTVLTSEQKEDNITLLVLEMAALA